MCQPFVKVCQRTGCSLPLSLCLCVYFLPDAGLGALTRQPWKWKCKRSVIHHPSPAVLCLEVSPPITGQDHRKLPSVDITVTEFAVRPLKLMCYLEQMKYDGGRGGGEDGRGGEGGDRQRDREERITWRTKSCTSERLRAKLPRWEGDGWKERRQGLCTCSV